MKLPIEFLNRMKKKMGEDFDSFLASYDGPTYTGLRVNTLKISVEAFLEIFPYTLEPIPWTEDGFYYREEDPVTKHPLFYAGLYYIQEPSAMSPVTVLKPESGETVLDLCAAPGGKSLQIASGTQDSGLLVTNDINDKRVKAIVRNIEKYGVKNVLVLNDDQYAIAKALPHFFDRILIDAPCSGEGMFKKDPKAIKAWEAYANETCAKMQREILEVVPALAKQNTKLVYSTCTFADVENEDQMQYLKAVDDDFVMAEIKSEYFDVTGGVAHLWPHQLKGEGHFIGAMTYLCKDHFSTDMPLDKDQNLKKSHSRVLITETAPKSFEAFENQYLNKALEGTFMVDREKLYLLPKTQVDVNRLHVARYGWFLGEFKRERFIPSQAFAMGLLKSEFKNVIDMDVASKHVMKFLKGETLEYDDIMANNDVEKGFCLFCVAGYPLGFVKIEANLIKNLYPVSWRMM